MTEKYRPHRDEELDLLWHLDPSREDYLRLVEMGRRANALAETVRAVLETDGHPGYVENMARAWVAYKGLLDDLGSETPETQPSLGTATPERKGKCPPHDWDRDGERCRKCGDKDWM